MKSMVLLVALLLAVVQGCSKIPNPLHPGHPSGPLNPVDPGTPLNPVDPGTPLNPVDPGTPTDPGIPGDVVAVWEVRRTDLNHTLLIEARTNPTIKGVPLAPGDYIGVFYTNLQGQQICGGYTVWDGSNVAITAWRNDALSTQKDGFSDGEVFNWKVRRASDGKDFNAQVQYTSGVPTRFAANAISMVASLMVE